MAIKHNNINNKIYVELKLSNYILHLILGLRNICFTIIDLPIQYIVC